MRIWKNGMDPIFMESHEPGSLDNGMILCAVSRLSYQGLQAMSALMLVAANTIGLSPAELVDLIKEL